MGAELIITAVEIPHPYNAQDYVDSVDLLPRSALEYTYEYVRGYSPEDDDEPEWQEEIRALIVDGINLVVHPPKDCTFLVVQGQAVLVCGGTYSGEVTDSWGAACALYASGVLNAEEPEDVG